mmetsp:Transcript_11723/g.22693  ORF Transcript_11723/g.22693 Transcript_11723/m.22693 type:complete len:94 (+) Transcript_11723:699-980(+)
MQAATSWRRATLPTRDALTRTSFARVGHIAARVRSGKTVQNSSRALLGAGRLMPAMLRVCNLQGTEAATSGNVGERVSQVMDAGITYEEDAML